MEPNREGLNHIRRMWAVLREGRSFDLIVVVTGNRFQRAHVHRHFQHLREATTVFRSLPIHVVSLDELGRPWRGRNFDASVFAIQRVRRLLTQLGLDEEEARVLIVLAAGSGTRAYPLTAAERGNKGLIYTPLEADGLPLRMVDLVITQYHQILEEIEPGRIHVAACDHVLSWVKNPQAPGRQPMQIFASRVSFADDLQSAGLADENLVPQWNDRTELKRRWKDLKGARLLPVLDTLTHLGLVKVDGEAEGTLHQMLEKADPVTIIEECIGCGAEARVNWWDWSVSAEAARMLVIGYGDLIGSGIDLSIDVLEPTTLGRDDWLKRRPGHSAGLWERAHALFANAMAPRPTPLGHIGVADPGEGSLFADVGTLGTLYETFSKGLRRDGEGDAYRALFNAQLEDGALLVGGRPGRGVEVEPGAIVIDGDGVRSGRIGSGSIVVSTKAGELITSGRNIVYGVVAPHRRLAVGDGEVAAGVWRDGRSELVNGRLFDGTAGGPDSAAWDRPRYGNRVSFADLHAQGRGARPRPKRLLLPRDRDRQAPGADQNDSPGNLPAITGQTRKEAGLVLDRNGESTAHPVG